MWYSCKRKKETPAGRFVLRLAVSATVNLQQFCKQRPDLPQLGGDISATRLFSPFTAEAKRSPSSGLSKGTFIAEGSEYGCVLHFTKTNDTSVQRNVRQVSSDRITSLLTCKTSQKSLAFSFPVWSAHSLLFTLVLALLLVSLPLKFTDSLTYIFSSSGQLPPCPWKNCWTLQQRASVAKCAMISNPTANWKLT